MMANNMCVPSHVHMMPALTAFLARGLTGSGVDTQSRRYSGGSGGLNRHACLRMEGYRILWGRQWGGNVKCWCVVGPHVPLAAYATQQSAKGYRRVGRAFARCIQDGCRIGAARVETGTKMQTAAVDASM